MRRVKKRPEAFRGQAPLAVDSLGSRSVENYVLEVLLRRSCRSERQAARPPARRPVAAATTPTDDAIHPLQLAELILGRPHLAGVLAGLSATAALECPLADKRQAEHREAERAVTEQLNIMKPMDVREADHLYSPCPRDALSRQPSDGEGGTRRA